MSAGKNAEKSAAENAAVWKHAAEIVSVGKSAEKSVGKNVEKSAGKEIVIVTEIMIQYSCRADRSLRTAVMKRPAIYPAKHKGLYKTP